MHIDHKDHGGRLPVRVCIVWTSGRSESWPWEGDGTAGAYVAAVAQRSDVQQAFVW